MKLLHKTKKINCLKSAEWKGGYLICKKCNTLIAAKYKIEDKINIMVYDDYKPYIKEINNIIEKNINEKDKYIGIINYDQFDELIENLKQESQELNFNNIFEYEDIETEE